MSESEADAARARFAAFMVNARWRANKMKTVIVMAVILVTTLVSTLIASADCHRDYQCWRDQTGRQHCGMNEHTNSAGCENR